VIQGGAAEETAALPPESGVGVIDTMTLWAAAQRLCRGGPFDLVGQDETDPSGLRGFLSFLHSVVLHDELRTDQWWILSHDAPWFEVVSEAVGEALSKLEQAVKITALPGGDDEAMRNVLPAFVAGVREAANSRNPEPSAAGTIALVSARRYAKAQNENERLNPLLLPWEEGGPAREVVDPKHVTLTVATPTGATQSVQTGDGETLEKIGKAVVEELQREA
jgi:hypothetical protein